MIVEIDHVVSQYTDLANLRKGHRRMNDTNDETFMYVKEEGGLKEEIKL